MKTVSYRGPTSKPRGDGSIDQSKRGPIETLPLPEKKALSDNLPSDRLSFYPPDSAKYNLNIHNDSKTARKVDYSLSRKPFSAN